MLRLKDKIEASVTYADRAGSATMADSANAVAWANVSGKPSTFTPASHEHDLSAMINKLSTGDSVPTDADYYVCQYAGGGTSTTSYHRRPVSALWSYIKTKTDSAYAAKSHTHSYLPLSGGTLTGQVNFGSSSYYVKADGTANFKTVTGAVYNDYAEFFPRGEATEPGDIVALDLSADHESYIKATATSKIVAGVHSDEYAMLIGGDKTDSGDDYVEKNLVNYIPVSLAGRVMCKVTGPVHRGDTIIVSDIPGVGIATDDENIPHKRVVGYVVEDDDRTDIRRVKIRVKG